MNVKANDLLIAVLSMLLLSFFLSYLGFGAGQFETSKWIHISFRIFLGPLYGLASSLLGHEILSSVFWAIFALIPFMFLWRYFRVHKRTYLLAGLAIWVITGFASVISASI